LDSQGSQISGAGLTTVYLGDIESCFLLIPLFKVESLIANDVMQEDFAPCPLFVNKTPSATQYTILNSLDDENYCPQISR